MSASHPPTASHLRELRRQGDIPREREAVAAAALVGAVIGLLATAPSTWHALTALVERACEAAAAPAPAWRGVAASGAVVLIRAVGPVLGGAVLGALLATAGQLGWPPALRWPWRERGPGAAPPALAHLRLGAVARRGAVAALRLGAVGLLLVAVLPRRPALARNPDELGRALVTSASTALIVAAVAFAALGLAEYALAYARWLARARMTPEQLRRELREQEGDPYIKARRQRESGAGAKQRRASAVADCDLVVCADGAAAAVRVAGTAATLVASATGALAARLCAAAHKQGRPQIERAELAHALCKLDAGAAVPTELLAAVREAAGALAATPAAAKERR